MSEPALQVEALLYTIAFAAVRHKHLRSGWVRGRHAFVPPCEKPARALPCIVCGPQKAYLSAPACALWCCLFPLWNAYLSVPFLGAGVRALVAPAVAYMPAP